MDIIDEFYKDKDLSLLKKLTLVIPTYNRNFYLSRCLWYHAHFPFGQIIVADSSPEEKKIINRQTVGKLREIFSSNILYLEYPPETEKMGGDIYRKWGDAVNHEKTDYSMLCADKEFTIPTTICTCIEYLDSHNDYSLAEGMHYIFFKDYGTKKIIEQHSRKSIDYDSIKDRFHYAVSSKENFYHLYSVLKLETDKKRFINPQKYNINDLRFAEIAIGKQALIYGKTKCFPDMPFNLRDESHVIANYTSINNSESSALRYPQVNDYPQEYYNTTFQNTKKLYHDLIYELSGIELEDDILNKLLPSVAKCGYQSKVLKKYKLLQYIWEKFPYSLKYIISKKFGEGHVRKPVSLNKITPEIKVVMKIINKFDQFHDADTPIIDVYSPSKK